jgi:methionyl-tRNA synthetase
LVLIKPLFVKIEQQMQTQTQVPSTLSEVSEEESYIDIEELSKVALRVGYIKSIEPIAKSDKLLKLEVDFGKFGTRTILAGIKQFYTSEALVNTQAIFVYNLKPRIMMGLMSQGMMLMARDEHGVPHIVRPLHAVPNGTQLS